MPREKGAGGGRRATRESKLRSQKTHTGRRARAAGGRGGATKTSTARAPREFTPQGEAEPEAGAPCHVQLLGQGVVQGLDGGVVAGPLQEQAPDEAATVRRRGDGLPLHVVDELGKEGKEGWGRGMSKKRT
jgi:hypothetical protein